MIIVDASIWIDHLHGSNLSLAALIAAEQVLSHKFVAGEVALGSLRQRATMLHLLQDLPQAIIAHDDEVLEFIEAHSIFGSGIGYVDAHLLVSARLSNALLWTRDKRLLAVATKLGVDY